MTKRKKRWGFMQYKNGFTLRNAAYAITGLGLTYLAFVNPNSSWASPFESNQGQTVPTRTPGPGTVPGTIPSVTPTPYSGTTGTIPTVTPLPGTIPVATPTSSAPKFLPVTGEDSVPEPGTLILLGSGLAGLAGYAHLRSRQKKS
jgi:hypothetical protein